MCSGRQRDRKGHRQQIKAAPFLDWDSFVFAIDNSSSVKKPNHRREEKNPKNQKRKNGREVRLRQIDWPGAPVIGASRRGKEYQVDEGIPEHSIIIVSTIAYSIDCQD